MSILHFTLATRDVATTARFFSAAMGWQPVDRPNNIPLQAAWLGIAPGQELHLLFVEGFTPSPFEAEFGRHFAVGYPRWEFPDLKTRLRELGADLIAPLREAPFERFFFRDPNGYVFEVVAT
jgi:catechol 2,3-dioxygenase-like lactoylglutathione lyase family enzyme